MKYQPNRNYKSNDDVQTPDELARRIVHHFDPHGTVLEPCAGDGAFLRALRRSKNQGLLSWCEIKAGRNFFAVPGNNRFDWIITTPPWSQIRNFLRQSMHLSKNIVFLMTVNHAWTKASIRDVKESGFHIHEIALVEMPKTFPQSGFQLGAVHWKRGISKTIKFSDISHPMNPKNV